MLVNIKTVVKTEGQRFGVEIRLRLRNLLSFSLIEYNWEPWQNCLSFIFIFLLLCDLRKTEVFVQPTLKTH